MTAMKNVGGKADEVRAEAKIKTEDDIIKSATSPTGQGCYLHFTDGDTKNHWGQTADWRSPSREWNPKPA